MLSACRTILINATTKDPKLILPNEYVNERRAAPLVAPEGIPPGFPAQKNHEPYTPAMIEWMVFFSHSVIQYPAKVMNTIKPMTFAEEQLPFPELLEPEQEGLLPPWEGS